MKTESPDTSYPSQQVKVKAPVQRYRRISASMKALATLVKKNSSNHDILLATKSIFCNMVNQIDPDKRAELLAGQIKLYEKACHQKQGSFSWCN